MIKLLAADDAQSKAVTIGALPTLASAVLVS
jgi:hypothetical protein